MPLKKRTYNPIEPDRPYSNNSTGYRGVSKHIVTGRFQVHKRGKNLGTVSTPEQGHILWEQH